MWTIKEFSQLTGVSPVALRYYDKEKILPSKRLANGYRSYDQTDLLIVKNLVVLKYAGFSLEDIKTMTSLYHEPEGQACNDQANEVLTRNLQEMKERIKLFNQIIEVVEGIMPLFENHELYKLNQSELNQSIDQIFDQISTGKGTIT
ncbi:MULTISPECIES: MerR family transcriptional regulator [Enterococcus]|uniref:MerR family transcriptional regulator n=1 Tax=Enterococcus TaxID=1350 RepID=UPI0008C40CBB|nr:MULTISPECIES: MerR family transcriptional regulator [Enterococcus]SES75990.1 DNA-binding transcriptional regulator, MerR family [Enterococcus malodoratus]HCM87231.1 MerR family transcriptional regulator [Enterococcus sp.]